MKEIDVRKLREKRGQTVDQFAVELGFAPFTVRRWEKGTHQPSPIARKLLEEISK